MMTEPLLLSAAHIRTHCPSCHAILELSLTCPAIDSRVGSPGESEMPSSGSRRQRTQAEEDVLAAARRAELLEPFYQTVRFVKHDQVPKDLDMFFITFVRGLTQRLIPAYAMAAFNQLFDHHPLAYYTAQGIGVVVVDGHMRLFVPNNDVVGTQLRQLGKHDTGKARYRTLSIDDGEVKLQDWIRTKWGYVAGIGALYEQLRNKSFGEFARPNLSAATSHRT